LKKSIPLVVRSFICTEEAITHSMLVEAALAVPLPAQVRAIVLVEADAIFSKRKLPRMRAGD
jgi:hypothetical protein